MISVSFPEFHRPAILGVLVALLFLTGCAGTRVSNHMMDSARLQLSRPQTISITIRDASPVPATQDRRTAHDRDVLIVHNALQEDLETLFSDRGLSVVPAGETADLALLCTLVEVRSGSPTARLLIGYGAGQAVLRLDSTLSITRQANRVLLAVSTSGTTGSMPGAGLGLVSAAGATGSTIAMAGPLIGVPSVLRQGLEQESRQATDRLDEQIGQYFAGQGWFYPRSD